MKKLILHISIFLVFGSQSFSQDKIRGGYGGDVRVRAGNGAIFEARVQNFNLPGTGIKNIALIYWPDNEIGSHKIGITVFENKTKIDEIPEFFSFYADSVITSRFESLNETNFKKIDTDVRHLEKYFKIRQIGPGVKISEEGKYFLDELKDEGYDGLFLLYESQLQDLFTASKSWLPSKGIFKFYKKELIYHGIYSLLINLDTKKPEKDIGYQQVSGDYYSGENIRELEDFDPIMDQMKIRFENNINEIIRIHKLK